MFAWAALAICKIPSSSVPSLQLPLYKSQTGLDDHSIAASLSPSRTRDENTLRSGEGVIHLEIATHPRLTHKLAERLSNSTMTNVRAASQHNRTVLLLEDFSAPPLPRFDVRNSVYIYPAALMTSAAPLGTTVRIWIALAHLSNQSRTLSIPELENAWKKALPCIFVPTEASVLQFADSVSVVVSKDSLAMATSMVSGLGPGGTGCDVGEVKVELPVPLSRSHRLIFKIVSLDHRGLEAETVGFASIRLFDEGAPVLDGYHAIEVVLSESAPKQHKKKTSDSLGSDSSTPTLVFRSKLVSSVYPQERKVAKLVCSASPLAENAVQGMNILSTSRGIISAFVAISHTMEGGERYSANSHMLRAIQTARAAAQGVSIQNFGRGPGLGSTSSSSNLFALRTRVLSVEDSISWFPLLFSSLLTRARTECSSCVVAHHPSKPWSLTLLQYPVVCESPAFPASLPPAGRLSPANSLYFEVARKPADCLPSRTVHTAQLLSRLHLPCGHADGKKC